MIVSGSIYNNAEDFSGITSEGFHSLESIVFEHKEFELMINGDHDCGSKACDMHIELLNAAAIVRNDRQKKTLSNANASDPYACHCWPNSITVYDSQTSYARNVL